MITKMKKLNYQKKYSDYKFIFTLLLITYFNFFKEKKIEMLCSSYIKSIQPLITLS